MQWVKYIGIVPQRNKIINLPISVSGRIRYFSGIHKSQDFKVNLGVKLSQLVVCFDKVTHMVKLPVLNKEPIILDK